MRNQPRISAAVERQVRAWVLVQENAEQQDRPEPPDPSEDRPDDVFSELDRFITISRECGAGGSHVAELVGRKLGWEVLDRSLLDQVADESNLPRSALEGVDETSPHWTSSILGTWLDAKSIPHSKYLVHLGRVVLTAARRGNVVFVGRGAQFFLPAGEGLAVRIIAPKRYRIRQIMRQHQFSEAKARRHVADVDRGRRQFVQRCFHRSIDDPHLYDLVINVARLGPVAAADKIIAAYQR
jgi:cytidylate kinase